ncbi:hypothetical protein GOODEAATRI_025751 [Goodea atripinnis]|uniref:Solute carrier family 41 member n=1 Tax=Goodea atripinnis TaxID=208336 RepID=A0ABV0MKU9_9TELE
MIGVIVASRKVGINPDNVATPIAASLGDLITLSLLAGISTGLYKELAMIPEEVGQTLKLSPLPFVKIFFTKVTLRCRESSDLLSEKDSQSQDDWGVWVA